MIDFWKQLFSREQPDLQRQKEMGAQAKRLLDDQAFSRAMMKVRIGLHERWASAPLEDMEGQLKLRLMLKLLEDVQANIVKEMNDGTFAEKILKDKEEKERKSNILNIIRR